MIGDTRIRRRVTTVVASGFTTGTVSANAKAAEFCDQHHISIVPKGTITAGAVRVRGKPVGTDSETRLSLDLESVVMSGSTQLTFFIMGFFDRFEVESSGLTGGSVTVVVNSTVSGVGQ